MTFTSSSVANKNNKFHVGPIGPGANLIIVINENLVFNILQRVVLRVPTIPVAFSDSLETDYKLEDINVDKVISSTCRQDDNLLWNKINGVPEKVISCLVKHVSLINKLIPLEQSNQVLAVAIYRYIVEVTYIDFSGKEYTENFSSSSRYQRIIIDSLPGRLDVGLDIKCIYTKLLPISPTSLALPLATSSLSSTLVSSSLPYKPTRLWLGTKVID